MKNKWEVFKGGIFLTRKTLKHFEFDIHNYLVEKKACTYRKRHVKDICTVNILTYISKYICMYKFFMH